MLPLKKGLLAVFYPGNRVTANTLLCWRHGDASGHTLWKLAVNPWAGYHDRIKVII